MKDPSLPAPPPDAEAHSRRLVDHLRAQIAANGPLRFDAYWDQVLYAPGLGYYAAGAGQFGAGGDFVTAPELGDVFARCLARQFQAVLQALDGGDILEFGAGSGRLAAAVLEFLDAACALPGSYRIVERSAALARRQRATLAARVPRLLNRVRWLDRLPEAPGRGVVFANEVLDALAPRRLLRDETGWRELHVRWQEDEGLAWLPQPLPAELEGTVAGIEAAWPEAPAWPYVTEVQPLLGPWVAAAADVVDAGLVLVCDYGYSAAEYYHPERRSGTLICHYRHRAFDDPFVWPGLVDLSVSVDFSAVAAAVAAAGLDLLGYATQAAFLLDTGVGEELAAAAGLPERERLARTSELKRLLLPGQMGERFKLLAAGRGLRRPLPGFGTGDDRARL